MIEAEAEAEAKRIAKEADAKAKAEAKRIVDEANAGDGPISEPSPPTDERGVS